MTYEATRYARRLTLVGERLKHVVKAEAVDISDWEKACKKLPECQRPSFHDFLTIRKAIQRGI